MTVDHDPGSPPSRVPWVTPQFEIIDTGDARAIAGLGQTTTVGDDDAVGS